MRRLISGGRLLLPEGCAEGKGLLLEGGRILDILTPAGMQALEPGIPHIDAAGYTVCPGFIDLHVHGGGGYEVNRSPAEDIARMCAAHARHGTTSILPTTLAAPLPDLLGAIGEVRKAQKQCRQCNILGIHLEGPFLSPAQGGAQNPEYLIAPTPENYLPLLDAWEGIRMMGAAVEREGALRLGEELKSRGIVASIAHSDASFEQVEAALQHGYSDVTHLYSGCSTVRREHAYRVAGVVEAGLYFDRLSVQVIADGKHLPPSLLKLIVKAKGAERISLVTDALSHSATGLREGALITQANGMPMLYEDGVFKLPDRQAFAGSAATMDRLVRNMVQLAGVSLEDAVRMASATPARVIGEKCKGELRPGMDADLVFLDADLRAGPVYVMGEKIS